MTSLDRNCLLTLADTFCWEEKTCPVFNLVETLFFCPVQFSCAQEYVDSIPLATQRVVQCQSHNHSLFLVLFS